MDRANYTQTDSYRGNSHKSFRQSVSKRKRLNEEHANLSESREASSTLLNMANNTFRYSVDRERSLNIRKQYKDELDVYANNLSSRL